MLMSTFGNNLIERLRTRLIDVRSEDQLGQGSIALAKNLSIGETRKPGIGRADCPVPLLCRLQPQVAHDGDSFDGF
jgi:hypothetical protein